MKLLIFSDYFFLFFDLIFVLSYDMVLINHNFGPNAIRTRNEYRRVIRSSYAITNEKAKYVELGLSGISHKWLNHTAYSHVMKRSFRHANTCHEQLAKSSFTAETGVGLDEPRAAYWNLKNYEIAEKIWWSKLILQTGVNSGLIVNVKFRNFISFVMSQMTIGPIDGDARGNMK